jgi:hypothetical protein
MAGTALNSIPVIALKPLPIAGLLVSRETIVEALRVYCPDIVDVQAVETGEFFILTLGAPGSHRVAPNAG